LFNNLGTGFKDFFYEPAQGIIRSPQEFGRGLAKGSLSLLKNSVYGLFNTISKITGAVGKGFASLSLDDEYLANRQYRQRKKPRHLGEGLFMGVKGLGMGIFDGVTGIVRKPVEGAIHGGASGFAKGMVQGVVGAAIKPITGAMDFATRTTEGVKNTTNLFLETPRVRPPRAFAQRGKVLTEYNFDESEGRFAVEVTHKACFKEDTYVYHIRNRKQFTIITNNRILCVKARNNVFKWQVPFLAISNVEMVSEGIKLSFYESEKILTVLDYRKSFTVQIEDKEKILLLCIMLRDCIRLRQSESEL